MAMKAMLGLMVACLSLALGQLSNPMASNSQVDKEGNKFLQRSAQDDKHPPQEIEMKVGSTCPLNVELKWMTELSSSIYATPLITDLFSDGRKDIIAPAFVHYLEVLEGPDGAQAVGWPGFHKSTLHTSPMLFDINLDGIREVMLATYDGEVMFFKENGERLATHLTVPRLPVRRDWYVGLAPDPTDHSKLDVGLKEGKDNPFEQAVHERGTHTEEKKATPGSPVLDSEVRAPQAPNTTGNTTADTLAPNLQTADNTTVGNEDKLKKFLDGYKTYRSKYGNEASTRLLEKTRINNVDLYNQVIAHLEKEEKLVRPPEVTSPNVPVEAAAPKRKLLMYDDREEGAGSRGRHLLEETAPKTATEPPTNKEVVTGDQVELPKSGGLSEEALQSFSLFDDEVGNQLNRDDRAPGRGHAGVDHAQDKLEKGAEGQIIDEDNGERIEEGKVPGVVDGSFDEFGDRMDWDDEQMRQFMMEGQGNDGGSSVGDAYQYHHPYFGDYDHGLGSKWDKGWQAETYEQAMHSSQSARVFVDAHILCNPAVGDIDGDGNDELVVAVSYFFDHEYYDDPAHAKDVQGVDLNKYVAGGIVVFDLRTKLIKWHQHLDLSTEETEYKAYMYSTPTLVDLDKDGKLDIVVGTSMGFVYIMDHKGQTRAGWPKQMGEIQGQVMVADFNNDGELEIFAGDALGNIVLWNVKGEEIWERHVRSMISHNPTAGDINSDGQLEIVFGTVSGHIHVIDAATGLDEPNFPFRTHGRIHSPVLITKLQEGPSQHLVVMSFDGYLYLVDGVTGCADSVDIGETSYSMVLADDLDNNGKLDLVVTTMNGVVYCFETQAKYHPLKTWTSQMTSMNGLVARYDYYGVYATAASREPRDIAGEKLPVKITIIDKRMMVAKNGTVVGFQGGPYNVSVVLKGVGVEEMNAGSQPVIGVADTFTKPGSYIMEIPCPRTRSTATVRVEMTDVHQLHFSDEFSLSFHMHFAKLLKWLLVLPLAGMVVFILAWQHVPPARDVDLPSFSMRA